MAASLNLLAVSSGFYPAVLLLLRPARPYESVTWISIPVQAGFFRSGVRMKIPLLVCSVILYFSSRIILSYYRAACCTLTNVPTNKTRNGPEEDSMVFDMRVRGYADSP